MNEIIVNCLNVYIYLEYYICIWICACLYYSVHEFLHVMLIILVQMTDIARAHGGDGGGEDPSHPRPVSFGCGGCFTNRGKNFWIIVIQA